MRKKKIKSKLILAFSLILILAFIIGGITIRFKYVILDNKLYKKDVKEILVEMYDTKISELNRCTNLETMSLWDMESHTLEKIKVFSELRRLEFSHAVSEISGSEIERINMFPKLNGLIFFCSDVNFNKINNDSVEYISISLSNINEIKALADCSSLTSLHLGEVTMDNGAIVKENADASNPGCYLKNSSDFAVLDNIEKLSFYHIQVEDISGILEMDSLKTVEVDQGAISEEDKKALEDKEITVIEDTDRD